MKERVKPVVTEVSVPGTGVSTSVAVGASPETAPSVAVGTSGPSTQSPTGQTTVTAEVPVPIVGQVQATVTLPVGIGSSGPGSSSSGSSGSGSSGSGSSGSSGNSGSGSSGSSGSGSSGSSGSGSSGGGLLGRLLQTLGL